MLEVFLLLEKWGIKNPTEQDIWDALSEINNDNDIYSDGDLAEWL